MGELKGEESHSVDVGANETGGVVSERSCQEQWMQNTNAGTVYAGWHSNGGRGFKKGSETM